MSEPVYAEQLEHVARSQLGEVEKGEKSGCLLLARGSCCVSLGHPFGAQSSSGA